MTYVRSGPESEQNWKVAFVDLSSGINISSDLFSSKKKAKQDASRLYLEYLYKNAPKEDEIVVQDEEGAVLDPKEYTVSEFSDTVDSSISADVEKLIGARDSSRSDRDYSTADDIRNKLWETYRVAVDDKSKTWSVGGDFGPKGTFRWTDDGPVHPRKGKKKTKINE